MSNTSDYLVMHRVMDREWKAYEKENVWGKGFTGFTEIAIHDAYKKAFMSGFFLKLTKGDE